MFMVLASSRYQIQWKITPNDMFVKGGRNVEVGMRNAEKKDECGSRNPEKKWLNA
jgi:hypothetical protein